MVASSFFFFWPPRTRSCRASHITNCDGVWHSDSHEDWQNSWHESWHAPSWQASWQFAPCPQSWHEVSHEVWHGPAACPQSWQDVSHPTWQGPPDCPQTWHDVSQAVWQGPPPCPQTWHVTWHPVVQDWPPTSEHVWHEVWHPVWHGPVAWPQTWQLIWQASMQTVVPHPCAETSQPSWHAVWHASWHAAAHGDCVWSWQNSWQDVMHCTPATDATSSTASTETIRSAAFFESPRTRKMLPAIAPDGSSPRRRLRISLSPTSTVASCPFVENRTRRGGRRESERRRPARVMALLSFVRYVSNVRISLRPCMTLTLGSDATRARNSVDVGSSSYRTWIAG